ncbi:Class V chitinase [Bienertia sinuspersici]
MYIPPILTLWLSNLVHERPSLTKQSTVAEMNNLAALLNEWRAGIKSRASRPQANSVATFPTQPTTNNLDWVNVMAYDFYD